jgi:hypothetical protein
MKDIKELKEAIANKTPLVWNDPDPIPGNDYAITFIEEIDEEEFDRYTPILIQYGGGSEAQVYLSEILYK